MLLLILLLISGINGFKLSYNPDSNEIKEIKDQDTIYELINYYHNIDFTIDNSLDCVLLTNKTLKFNNNGYLCFINGENSTYYIKVGILYYKCINAIDIYNCTEDITLQECTDMVYKLNLFIKKNNNSIEFYNYINTSIISFDDYYYQLKFNNPFDDYFLINNKDIISKKSLSYDENNNIKNCNLFIKYKTPLYTNKINVIKFNDNIYVDFNKFNSISFKNIPEPIIYKSKLKYDYYYNIIIVILLALIFTIIIKKCRDRKKKYTINKTKNLNKELFNKNGELILVQDKSYKIKNDGVYNHDVLIVKGLPKILFFKNYLKYSEENNGSVIDVNQHIIIVKQINNNLNILNLDYFIKDNILYKNSNPKDPLGQINDNNNLEIEIIDKTKYSIENGNLYNKKKLLISKLYKY